MGLDMYLSAHEYVSGWGHGKPEEQERFRGVLGALGHKPKEIAEGSPHIEIKYSVAYWRKANAIHAWFVKNVQDGKDECQESYVSVEQLQALRDLAAQALASDTAEAGRLLPPQDGFFFGSTDLDEGYRFDLKATVKQLDRVLADWKDRPVSFYYQSSW